MRADDRDNQREIRRPQVGDRVSRLPAVAAFFVMIVLALLALVPTVILWRFHRLQQEGQAGHTSARPLAAQLLFAVERQVAAQHGYRLGANDQFLAEFEAARETASSLYRQLPAYAAQIGPDAERHLAAAARVSDEWRALTDSLIAEGVGADEYAAQLPRLEALHDAQLRAVLALQQEIELAAATQIRDAERMLTNVIARSLVLAILGGAALIVVGWFVHRERKLSLAVQRAMDEEAILREESERQRADLERVTESRARLMRGFSHDVKNPLGAADGFLQLLADGIMGGPLTEKQATSVQRARRSIRSALNLVDDLLALARAEAGTLELDISPTDLAGVVQEVADDYRAQAAAKRLYLRVELPDGLPPVHTDATRVRQILGNLLSNAVKYTTEGGVTVKAEHEPGDTGDASDGHVAVHIVDTGPGISKDQQAQLFQEFARLSPAAGNGAGIGLAISSRLAEVLGGEIQVDTEPGRGSVFSLVLPVGSARRATKTG